MQWGKNKHGFTIVELLIVIVVIGILAAITIVAYNGVQGKAQTNKIAVDLSNLEKAIIAARQNEGKALVNITNNGYSALSCHNAASGTDLTNRSLGAVNACWTVYTTSLDRISNASGIDVRNLVDPWGRPYRIDENENEVVGSCNKDIIGTFLNPHIQSNFNNVRYIPNSIAGC